MLISLFIACYNDTLFPDTGKAVVRVLERLGHTVEFRSAQTCCGQMHYNTGYHPEAVSLMRHFLDVFHGAETICVPSASCVAMIRDHFPKMAAEVADPAITAAVADLLPRVFEFTELLVDKLGVTDVGATYPHSVTLHTSCHSLRSLHIGDKPQRLLREVRGLDLIELDAADRAAASAAPSPSKTQRSRPQCSLKKCVPFSTPARKSAPPAITPASCTSAADSAGKMPTPAASTLRRSSPHERSCRRVRKRSRFSQSREETPRQHATPPQCPPRHRHHPQQARNRRWRDARLGGSPRFRPTDQATGSPPSRYLP